MCGVCCVWAHLHRAGRRVATAPLSPGRLPLPLLLSVPRWGRVTPAPPAPPPLPVPVPGTTLVPEGRDVAVLAAGVTPLRAPLPLPVSVPVSLTGPLPPVPRVSPTSSGGGGAAIACA